MRNDPNVVIMGEDIAGGAGRKDEGIEDSWGGPFGTTKGLIKEFGSERVLDTPITESGFMGAAVGAAATGIRPIVELMFVDFAGVAFDQIINQAAKLRYMFGGKAKVPLTIRTAIGGGMSAAAQHSQVLYPLFAHIPGLKAVAPSNPYDMKGLLATAIRDDDPVVVLECKSLLAMKGNVPEESYSLPLGQAVTVREGTDVTLVALSAMVNVSLKAAAKLEETGISAEIIDPRSLSPLDEEAILASVAKTGRLVVVDEDTPRCSMATDISALVADKGFDYLDAPIKMVTAPHTPVPFSPPLEKFYLPNADKVIAAVKEITGG
jgi:pyruvate dehydrogenase E1 component beta subunit